MNQTILITNQLATGSAFALTEGSNENVFIPSKVMIGKSVRPGEKVQAIVVPNMTRPDKTPWVAIAFTDVKPVSPRDTLAELILGDLDQGRATVEEIAENLNMADEKIAAMLSEMVADGRVVRLTCFDLPGDEA